ncbi:hypothetical protein GH714_011506 [Hevea brasiliensis]|uniref:Uncharacterized protein n=1 Tax=Hevea brasiliensis TaxID=3981 RepID=A0A6A6KL08_HEVBR|nr:hypothetical protein GH714_011506 [Hevea brasiliensis]
MHVEMHDPSSAAQGEKQHGKGGGTPKKECKRGDTPKLQKGPPPGEKVGCARDNVVARSLKEESPPREGALLGGNVCGSRFSGQTGQPGKQESCREEQAKMRLSLPTACQNEVQRGWRRTGRLLGKPGDGRPKMRFRAKSGAQQAHRGCASRVGSARADKARNEVHCARERARERLGCTGQAYGNEVQTCAGRLGRAGSQTCGRGSN